ncbi:hypothetical protein FAIPA1_290018 [Frankia sp. AiPs1]
MAGLPEMTGPAGAAGRGWGADAVAGPMPWPGRCRGRADVVDVDVVDVGCREDRIRSGLWR